MTVENYNIMDCPICNSKNSLKVISKELDIPYIGKVLETTIICDRCKYRKSDILPLEVKEPKRYILEIGSEDDLLKRVVKSSTGHIKIPELGFEVKPGPASEGYVSNVEGVLNRMESSLKTLINWAETDEEKENALKVYDKLDEVKKGKRKVTLIIEDPLGHSMIIGDGVKEEKLSDEEIKMLNSGGIFIMDKSEKSKK